MLTLSKCLGIWSLDHMKSMNDSRYLLCFNCRYYFLNTLSSVLGRDNQLSDFTSCHGRPTISLSIFAFPSASAFVSFTLSHLIPISTSTRNNWNSDRTNLVASSNPKTEICWRASGYRLNGIANIFICECASSFFS